MSYPLYEQPWLWRQRLQAPDFDQDGTFDFTEIRIGGRLKNGETIALCIQNTATIYLPASIITMKMAFF